MNNIVKFSIFLGISIIMFYLVVKGQDIDVLMNILKKNVHYEWIIYAYLAGIASHISRAMRWQQMTLSMNYKIRLANSFMGVMIGYFANLAIPRMGEFSRCAVVSKFENVPFAKLLGNIVAERIIDIIILFTLTVIVIFTQFNQLDIFLHNNPSINNKLQTALSSTWVLVCLIATITTLTIIWKLWLKKRIQGRISVFINGFKDGIIAIRNINNLPIFIAHSIFIWTMYYLMFYLSFFCFDFTSELSPLVALSIFVISSYGMIAPVQGGIGAWHFMVIAALYVYLPYTNNLDSLSKAFAILTHGSMMLLYIILGCLSLIVLPIYNKKVNKK